MKLTKLEQAHEIERLQERIKELEDKLRHPDVETAHSVIYNFLNCFGTGKCDDFAKEMSQSHRTLQQNFTRLCISWLMSLAALPDNWYDLRNEGSVKFAKSIMQQLDNSYLPMV